MDSYALDFIKQKMKEYSIDQYTVNPILIKVIPTARGYVNDTNDYSLMVNFYVETGVVNAQVEAENTAIYLNPSLAASEYYKIKFFDGQVSVLNNGASDLYVEFLRIVPVIREERK